MRDFSEKAQAWLDRIAQKTEAPFTLHRNYICGERIFPLVQLMTVRDHHPILSFRTEKGRWGVSGERCYFDVCETLDNAGLDAYFRFLSETQATAVAYTDPEHDYTFVSLVVLTADVNDSALVKRIKRFRQEKRYHVYQNEYGWSSCRLCVVDLSSGQIYRSAMADVLKNRII